MAILSRIKINPQQRFDLEELLASQAAQRSDSKLWTQKFLSESNLILSGFSVTGIGLSSATVAMTGCSLIIPQNTFDFSYFVSAPIEPDVTIPASDLVDGVRNYLELELATQDQTPLTKAFWDPEANSGNGAEFNQIVNTITDLKVNFVVLTGGFSGLPNRIPVAIIDTDGTGVIKIILDRRDLFGRLAKPTNLDNEFVWGVKVEPVYNLNLTGVVGTFVAGEIINIGPETAKVVTGGTTSITFNEPSGISFVSGNTVTGITSGATGTINTVAESFVGVDKNLKGQKNINDAVMTEIKDLKGTRFWWQPSPSLIGIKTEIASLIAPITGGAKIKWDGSKVIITDDNLIPSDADQVASIRLLSSTANLMLTRQDDGKEVVTVTFPKVADAGILVLNQNGNLISIDWDDSTAAIQTAWNASGAYAATISGSVAAEKIVITANAAGNQVNVIQNSNTLTNAGIAVPATITIKQGMASDGSITLTDGQFLYVDLPNPLVGAIYDGVGVGALNYKVASRGSFSITDQAYWLAYREGTKLVWRFAGELQPGEETQVSDNVPQGLLDAIGIVSETSMPSYESDIRGYPQESLVSRVGVLTDAEGDEQEDRSGYLRSDDVVTWTGTQLQFTQNIVLEFLNTKTGTLRQHVVSSAASPVTIGNGQSIYVLIDREASSPQSVTLINSGTTPIPAQSQAQKDVFILFRRNDVAGTQFLHIPFHKQVLEPGQSVNLGASGAGSGGGDSLFADYKRRLVLSPFLYLTPVVFEFAKNTLTDLSSTGAFSPAKKAFEIDTAQTFVSVQMLDSDFLNDGVDVDDVELWLNWLDGFVDTAATYEVSRNGGNHWQTVTMSRVGVSGSYRGYHTFTTEPANQDLQGYAVSNADTNNTLDTTTAQSRAQPFTVTSQEVVKQVELYLNKLGSALGTFTAKIVKDSAGAPSTSPVDILSESNPVSISALGAGNNTSLVTLPSVVLSAGTYWLIIETDAAYKASFSLGVTELRVRADTSAPTAPNSFQFNGSVWSVVAGNALTYQLKGRLHDLRVRITSSTVDRFISGFGLYYGIEPGVTTASQKLVQREFFAGSLNKTDFTLNWLPDPDLIEVFDAYRGQVYVAADGVFKINGFQIIFEPNTFNDPGEDILLIFRQTKGTSFDNSDQNANSISTIQSQIVTLAESDELSNVAIAASVAANALTISLKGKDGNNPSVVNFLRMGFRNILLDNGTFNTRTVTTPVSTVISSGSTLGHASGVDHYIYVYALDNAGTIEIAYSTTFVDEGILQTTTAEGGAGGADSNRTLYSTTARTNVPVRFLGRIKSNQATAGTWASAPTVISLNPHESKLISAKYSSSAGQTIPNNTITIVDFGTKVIDTHNAVVTGGSWSLTVVKTGLYRVRARVTFTAIQGVNLHNIYFYVNGVAVSGQARPMLQSGTNVDWTLEIVDDLPMVAGDTFNVRVQQNSGGNESFNTTPSQNNVSITYSGSVD